MHGTVMTLDALQHRIRAGTLTRRTCWHSIKISNSGVWFSDYTCMLVLSELTRTNKADCESHIRGFLQGPMAHSLGRGHVTDHIDLPHI